MAIGSQIKSYNKSAVMIGGFAIAAGGAYEISLGAITLGDLVAFLAAISRLSVSVRSLAKATGRLQRGVAGARRVTELLDVRST